MKLVDDLDAPRTVILQSWVQPLGPENIHASCRERASYERPVSLDEAEHAADSMVVSDYAAHHVNLLDHAVDQLGAISATNQELLNPRADQTALDHQTWTSLVTLRVDDEDSAGCDGEVVDIRGASGDLAIMEDAERVASKLIEASAEALLAERASVPGLGRLRVVGQREDEPSEPAVLAAEAVLSACVTTLELAPGGGAWHPRVDLPRRLRRYSWRLM